MVSYWPEKFPRCWVLEKHHIAEIAVRKLTQTKSSIFVQGQFVGWVLPGGGRFVISNSVVKADYMLSIR